MDCPWCKASRKRFVCRFYRIIFPKFKSIKSLIMEKVNMDSLVVVLDTLEKLGFNSQFEVNGKIWFHYKQITFSKVMK
jgi:hypothetical protein